MADVLRIPAPYRKSSLEGLLLGSPAVPLTLCAKRFVGLPYLAGPFEGDVMDGLGPGVI